MLAFSREFEWSGFRLMFLCKTQQVVVLRCVLYNIVPVCVSPMPYPGSGPYVCVCLGVPCVPGVSRLPPVSFFPVRCTERPHSPTCSTARVSALRMMT